MDKKYGFMELKSNQSVVYIFGLVQLPFVQALQHYNCNTTTYMHQHPICCKLKPVLLPDIFYSANKS